MPPRTVVPLKIIEALSLSSASNKTVPAEPLAALASISVPLPAAIRLPSKVMLPALYEPVALLVITAFVPTAIESAIKVIAPESAIELPVRWALASPDDETRRLEIVTPLLTVIEFDA